jgi:hypothetical protein
MNNPKTIASLVQPGIISLASRLFVLSTWRPGSKKWKPTVESFYETGLVTAIYEQLLMSPALAHLDIRHEMEYQGPKGAPKQVDLWFRQLTGGHPTLMEAGDWSVGKVHEDIKKIKRLNPKGYNWFLAFFRKNANQARNPFATLETSSQRTGGLDLTKVKIDRRLTGFFEVYRPDGNHDPFGFALIKAR